MTRRNPRVVLAELNRDVCFGVDPRASRLWPDAPPHLKRDLVYGYIDPGAFWRQLRRWVEFEERARIEQEYEKSEREILERMVSP